MRKDVDIYNTGEHVGIFVHTFVNGNYVSPPRHYETRIDSTPLHRVRRALRGMNLLAGHLCRNMKLKGLL